MESTIYKQLKEKLYQTIPYNSFNLLEHIPKVKYHKENIRIVLLDDGTYLVYKIENENTITILSVQ